MATVSCRGEQFPPVPPPWFRRQACFGRRRGGGRPCVERGSVGGPSRPAIGPSAGDRLSLAPLWSASAAPVCLRCGDRLDRSVAGRRRACRSRAGRRERERRGPLRQQPRGGPRLHLPPRRRFPSRHAACRWAQSSRRRPPSPRHEPRRGRSRTPDPSPLRRRAVSFARGKRGGLQPRAGAELVRRGCDQSLHGRTTEAQPASDLGIAETGGRELEHLLLAAG